MEERNKRERDLLQFEIERKNIQLLAMRDFLVRKIDIIGKLEDIKTSSQKSIILKKEDWEEMEVFLNSVDDEFVKRIKCHSPTLTIKDIHFIMLIRLRIPISSIALIYHIEEKSGLRPSNHA